MNEIKKFFYYILSNYFSEKKIEFGSNKQEQKLEDIALANKVITFFCESANLVKVDVSENIKSLTLQIVAHNYKYLNVQKNVIQKLYNNNIACAILKGTSVSVNYPDPVLRPLGDIDLLVSSCDYDKCIELFINDTERDKVRSMHKFHYQIQIDGICVEIHKAVTDFLESELNIKEYMDNALKRVAIKKIDCFEFPVLLDDFQTISLLLHTKRHYFENELNIRMLCDWGMHIDKIDESLYRECIYPLLKALRLNRWADVLSVVCKRYLNINCEDKIFSDFEERVVEQLANEFISDSLKFDLGDKERGVWSVKNLIFFLNSIAKRDYRLARRTKLLLPIFWVVIGVRYLYRRRIGLRKKTDILKYSKEYYIKEKIFDEI